MERMSVRKFVREVLLSSLKDMSDGFTIYIPKEDVDTILNATAYGSGDLVFDDEGVRGFRTFTLSHKGNGQYIDNRGNVYTFEDVASTEELKESIIREIRKAPIPTWMRDDDEEEEIEIEYSILDYSYYYPILP